MTTATQNVLFLVTGMTPAIITETIWALACDPKLDADSRWIPDRVEVLSTEHGLNQIRSRLLDSGVLERFKQDFPQLAAMQFSESYMHSITDEQTALEDLKTPDDNEFAADQIHERIRALTQDPNVSLHVSIAGGRKTMGFYAGYALSLHGRAQDRMSHVLVDEKYENIPNFFYPTSYEHFVTNRDNRAFDARKAKVWLAEIPFVRMHGAIAKRHQIHNASFSETVGLINEASNDVKLVIDVPNKQVVVNDKLVIDKIAAREFSLLCLHANDKINGGKGFKTPAGSLEDPNISPAAAKYINELTVKFRAYYSLYRDEDIAEDKDVGAKFFEQARSGLKKLLEEELGLELAAKVAISKKGGNFELNTPASAITMIGNIKQPL